MIEAKMPILHNGRLYREGENIIDITPEQATLLVETGSADWQRITPDIRIMPGPQEGMFVTDSIDFGEPPRASPEDVDWDAEVRQYHRGFGNYNIPGVGMVKGKDAAIEALKTAREKG